MHSFSHFLKKSTYIDFIFYPLETVFNVTAQAEAVTRSQTQPQDIFCIEISNMKIFSMFVKKIKFSQSLRMHNSLQMYVICLYWILQMRVTLKKYLRALEQAHQCN